MKTTLLLLGLLCLSVGALQAESGTRRKASVDPTSLDHGNTCRPIQVSNPLGNWVLISSEATRAVSHASTEIPLGITDWRIRTVVNKSSHSDLFIHHTNTQYTTAITSFGIVLSSATALTSAVTSPNSMDFFHQGEIWGIYILATTVGPGVGGQECYYSQNNIR